MFDSTLLIKIFGIKSTFIEWLLLGMFCLMEELLFSLVGFVCSGSDEGCNNMIFFQK